MNDRNIFVTAHDKRRLEELLAVGSTVNHRDRNDLKSLRDELGRGQVLKSKDVPPDVVTMNSRVRLVDLDDGSEMEVQLVFPDMADIAHGHLSVLSPVGTAILGYREGETVAWKVPDGERHLRIDRILYQPEAAGDYHL